MLFRVDRVAYMETLCMNYKHRRLSLLRFTLELAKEVLVVGLELVRQFYIRQDHQLKFLVKV